jgi:hypothetical protein
MIGDLSLVTHSRNPIPHSDLLKAIGTVPRMVKVALGALMHRWICSGDGKTIGHYSRKGCAHQNRANQRRALVLIYSAHSPYQA